MKVLIAEDDDFTVLMLKNMLRNLATEIIIARNGMEAVEKFQTQPDIQLVLMDILMPEMNGYEATKKIRSQNQKVVIIVQTALASSKDKKEAFKAGCTGFINKPVNKENLIRLINEFFSGT